MLDFATVKMFLEAGYTKAEIESMQMPAPAPAPAQAQNASHTPVILTEEQLTQLIQGISVRTAAGTIETPPTAQTSLEKLYTRMYGVPEKKEG